jgi:hypothetical protein
MGQVGDPHCATPMNHQLEGQVIKGSGRAVRESVGWKARVCRQDEARSMSPALRPDADGLHPRQLVVARRKVASRQGHSTAPEMMACCT